MINHHFGFCEYRAQRIFYDDVSGGVTCTCAIEKHMLYHRRYRAEFRIFSDLTFDQLGGVKERIETHCME
jgi:hypothetical protein